nr:pedal peptide 2 [Ambigolimax valentianus]
MRAMREFLLLMIVSALAFGDEVPDGEIKKRGQTSELDELELDKKSIDSIGSSFIKRPVDSIGSSFIKKAIDSIGSSFIKRPIDSIGSSFIKRPIDSIGSSFIKKGIDSIGSSFIKRPIDSIGSSFIKRPIDSIGSSFIKKGIDSIGSSFIKRPIDSIGSSFIKRPAHAYRYAVLEPSQDEQEMNDIFSRLNEDKEWSAENYQPVNFIEPNFARSEIDDNFDNESDDDSKRAIDSIGSSFIKRRSDDEYDNERDNYIFAKENESMRKKRSTEFQSLDKVPVNYILNRLYENNKDTRSDLTYGDIMSLVEEQDSADSSRSYGELQDHNE